jgi:hypothetical protein
MRGGQLYERNAAEFRGVPRNPIIAGVRSHIYSYGHRNPQGLAFAPDGKLYESEHGPNTDDEVNVIRAGGNYGWPHVAGYQDDQSYAYANWSASKGVPCESLTFTAYRRRRRFRFKEERLEPSRFAPIRPSGRCRRDDWRIRAQAGSSIVLADRRAIGGCTAIGQHRLEPRC